MGASEERPPAPGAAGPRVPLGSFRRLYWLVLGALLLEIGLLVALGRQFR
jgi:hypothetical protein